MDAAFARSRRLAEERRRSTTRPRRPRPVLPARLRAVSALAIIALVAGGLSLAATNADSTGSAARLTPVALGSPAAVVPSGCPVPARFRPAFGEASLRTGVPLSLLVAVAQGESSMRPDARSPAGAVGLMQLMPATAAELGFELHRPAANVMGGAVYLAGLLDRFDGDLALALAAYNAGPGAVERAGGAPSGAVLRYAADVQSRAASLAACDRV
jgi:soluble lytic murein transglycosylase-like protein